MKKMEYLAPAVQVIALKSKASMLVGSGETAPGGAGEDD